MARVVGHIDLDYFYAQVEEVERPSLKGAPVLVCVFSGRTEESGVVSTANYKAREYGIKSGMPIVSAKRRLNGIEATFIPMNHEKYEVVSRKIMETVSSRVDVLEQAGIDEAFFDITHSSQGDYGRAVSIAFEIKRAVYESERLTCSIGLAPDKVLAKMASDIKKPDGLTVVRPEEVAGFLQGRPVESIYGVGAKTAQALNGRGVRTIDQLATTDVETLEEMFGKKLAVYLHDAANGADREPVEERKGATQMSRIITLKSDSRDAEEIFAQLDPAMEDLHRKVIDAKVFFRSVSVISILSHMEMRTKGRRLDTPTDDLGVLRSTAHELLNQSLRDFDDSLRRVGIRVTELTDAFEQGSLMEYMGG